MKPRLIIPLIIFLLVFLTFESICQQYKGRITGNLTFKYLEFYKLIGWRGINNQFHDTFLVKYGDKYVPHQITDFQVISYFSMRAISGGHDVTLRLITHNGKTLKAQIKLKSFIVEIADTVTGKRKTQNVEWCNTIMTGESECIDRIMLPSFIAKLAKEEANKNMKALANQGKYPRIINENFFNYNDDPAHFQNVVQTMGSLQKEKKKLVRDTEWETREEFEKRLKQEESKVGEYVTTAEKRIISSIREYKNIPYPLTYNPESGEFSFKIGYTVDNNRGRYLYKIGSSISSVASKCEIRQSVPRRYNEPTNCTFTFPIRLPREKARQFKYNNNGKGNLNIKYRVEISQNYKPKIFKINILGATLSNSQGLVVYDWSR